MQKAGADGVPKPDLSTAGRKRRKLALGVVLTSSMLLQKRRGCLAGLGVACRLYIIFTVKMKPAFLKQTLLFPAGLMLRGFDFRLASKIQKIYSPFLTSLLLHLFLNFSFQARFRERVRGWNPCSFFNRHGRKKWPGDFIYVSPLTSGIFLTKLPKPSCFVYQSKRGNKVKKFKA